MSPFGKLISRTRFKINNRLHIFFDNWVIFVNLKGLLPRSDDTEGLIWNMNTHWM